MDKLKTLLAIEDDSFDTVLQFILDKVREMILNYCNIDEIPPGLENTMISMAIDIFKTYGYGKKQNMGDLKSIKEGDVTLEFQQGCANSEDLGLAMVKSSTAQRIVFLRNYTIQLDRYRKNGW